MKRKEKIIGSLVIAVLAIVFLFIGYSKPKSEELSKEEMERLFLDVEEKDEDENEENNSYKKSENNNKVSNEASSSGYFSGEDEAIEENRSNNELDNESKGNIVVEVKGEVKNPNIYVLEEGSRIFEVIDMAGGTNRRS
ncbi:SLBB domain-containing protein [Clostridium sp. B9]|uniref:SLBB domain-containing protein n=1 Tax=Clostridium sp. B9 TaxID=3423224 RepID=UPI003D2F2DB8